MSSVAAILVTHNSERFLPDTLASIESQTQTPNHLVAVDDGSTDGSVELLQEAGFHVQRATSQSHDVNTRVAHNFTQGVRMAQSLGAEVAVLGDHDDVWHSNRVEHQTGLLAQHRDTAMVASNAYLMDEWGVALPGTLRDTFPVPDDFNAWSTRRQWAYGLRHSLATGGASALRLDAFEDWSVPAGWLHDRWWSLKALRDSALLIDATPVIDYRVSPEQQVGMDTAFQDKSWRWWLGKTQAGMSTMSRVADVRRLARG